MSKQIFTIYDKVARRGNNLFLASNQDEAKRIFENSMKSWQRQNPDFNPSDYTCFFLGYYYDEDVIKTDGPDSKDVLLKESPFLVCSDSVDLYDVPLDKELE